MCLADTTDNRTHLVDMARHPAILLAAATAICLLPWLNRAFDIDEPQFLWSAEQIVRDPLDFYGGQLNWYGFEQPFCEVIKNPPLNAFYLAAVGAITGFDEVPMHLAMLVWSVLAIVGTYFLAARLCDRPALAAATMLAMPAFLVSSTSVMCDVPMVALWIWSLVLWLRGIEDRRLVSLAGASLLMAACALTKYFGIAVVPLGLVYAVVRRHNVGWWTLWLLIPLGISAAFEVFLREKYGTGAFLDAASYATRAVGDNALSVAGRGFITLLFAGGSLLPVILFAPWVWSRWGLLIWLLIALAIGGALAYRGTIITGNLQNYPLRTVDGLHGSALVQTTLFATAALQLLALAVGDALRKRDATTVLLGLWVLGTLVFAGWINWSINVRSILPAAPAAAILIARRLDVRWPIETMDRRFSFLTWTPLAAGLAFALALCWVDYRSANANRSAAIELITRYGRQNSGSDLWFTGHWGLQYYLQRAGAIPIDLRGSELREGDVILVPEDNPTGVEVSEYWSLRETLEPPLPRWLTTTSLSLQTSFYSSVLGPVPYYVGRVPPRRFRVYDPFKTVNPAHNPARASATEATEAQGLLSLGH